MIGCLASGSSGASGGATLQTGTEEYPTVRLVPTLQSKSCPLFTSVTEQNALVAKRLINTHNRLKVPITLPLEHSLLEACSLVDFQLILVLLQGGARVSAPLCETHFPGDFVRCYLCKNNECISSPNLKPQSSSSSLHSRRNSASLSVSISPFSRPNLLHTSDGALTESFTSPLATSCTCSNIPTRPPSTPDTPRTLRRLLRLPFRSAGENSLSVPVSTPSKKCTFCAQQQRSIDSMSVFRRMCRQGEVAVVRLLIQFEPSFLDVKLAFMDTCQRGFTSLVNLLLKNFDELKVYLTPGLESAARHGHMSTVARLLDEGPCGSMRSLIVCKSRSIKRMIREHRAANKLAYGRPLGNNFVPIHSIVCNILSHIEEQMLPQDVVDLISDFTFLEQPEWV